MATYGRVMSSIWTDPDFTALQPQVQQVYLLLLSSSSRNHAGVLPLTLRRWAKCSAGATIGSIEAALNALADANFVVVDWETEEVLVRTYIRNDGVWKQPQVMRAALKSAVDVQSYPVRNALAAELNSLPGFDLEPIWQQFAKLLVDTPSAACAQPAVSLRAGSGEGEGEGEGVEPSFQEKGKPFFSVQLDGATVPVVAAVRTVVQASVPAAVLRSRKTRDGLFGHAQRLYDEGATIDQLAATIQTWARRTDVYPGHLPHIYAELARGPIASTTRSSQRQAEPHKLRTLAQVRAEVQATENHARKELS